ncbi:MAG: MucB/RseB C-terminal domain-containing protein [Pseudomonadota bacterium]
MSVFSAAVMAAEHDAAAWLERMIRSAHQLNYTGTFVYQQNGSLQSMKIIHAVSENGERERLVSLTGPSREVIRNRAGVTCFLPEDSSIAMEHSPGAQRPRLPLNLPSDLDPLREFYEIHLEGEDRIAGLSARKVVIVPRDVYRYGHSFWVAIDSGLLLRAEVVNEKGEIVEQVMFTSLEMHESIPESQLQPQFSGKAKVLQLGRKSQPNKRPKPAHTEWQVSKLPTGFSQRLLRTYLPPGKQHPVQHHVYSDGLASVSVFIERHGDEGGVAFTGGSAMGGVNAYGRLLDEYSVTVVGEVPPVTVRQIAESLRRVQP